MRPKNGPIMSGRGISHQPLYDRTFRGRFNYGVHMIPALEWEGSLSGLSLEKMFHRRVSIKAKQTTQLWTSNNFFVSCLYDSVRRQLN